MVAYKTIEEFLSPKEFAMVGVSTNKKKFGFVAFRDLIKRGYKVIPVNPKATEIDGEKCYPNITEIPEDINRILIATPTSQTEKIVEEAVSKGIKHIWIQQKAETDAALELANKNNMDVVYKKCILMFAEPGAHMVIHATYIGDRIQVFSECPDKLHIRHAHQECTYSWIHLWIALWLHG